MVLLAADPMPDYIVVIPLLYFGLFVFIVLAVGIARARKPRPKDDVAARRRRRSSDGRSSDDDIWLASYLSEAHREQYHDRS